MTSVPDDIKNNILKLAKINDEDPKVLMGRLKEIMETDETIKAMKEFEHKIRFAWAKLYSEFSLSGDVKPCYIRPIAQPRPRKIEIKEEPTWVGELICVAQLIEKDDDGKETLGDPMYCAGTLWRDGAKLLNKLEKDKPNNTIKSPAFSVLFISTTPLAADHICSAATVAASLVAAESAGQG